MTPKLDTLCIELLKRIPDQFQSVVVPGTGELPDAFNISAISIIDYVNRALGQLFNNFWQSSGGDIKTFIGILPELTRFSPPSDPLSPTGGIYDLDIEPYKNLYRVIGAGTDSGKFIKIKDETLFASYFYHEYDNELKPTENDAVLIQVEKSLYIFPNDLDNDIKIHYIIRPVDPTTGNALTQNGDYDSPFYAEWNNQIVDLAYLMYLKETNQTT